MIWSSLLNLVCARWSVWFKSCKCSTYLLYQSHQQLCEEKLQERAKSVNMHVCFWFLSTHLSLNYQEHRHCVCVYVCMFVPSHHFKKSSHEEPFAYSRWPRKVELVAESWGKDKVVHVYRHKEKIHSFIIKRLHLETLVCISVWAPWLPLWVRLPG